MSQTVNYTRHTILLKCQVLTTCLSKLNLKRVESRLGGIGTKIRCDMRSSSGLSETQQKNWRFENVDKVRPVYNNHTWELKNVVVMQRVDWKISVISNTQSMLGIDC